MFLDPEESRYVRYVGTAPAVYNHSPAFDGRRMGYAASQICVEEETPFVVVVRGVWYHEDEVIPTQLLRR